MRNGMPSALNFGKHFLRINILIVKCVMIVRITDEQHVFIPFFKIWVCTEKISFFVNHTHRSFICIPTVEMSHPMSVGIRQPEM